MVSSKADKYYVSILVEVPDTKIVNHNKEGIGIDLGLRDFAVVSNGKTYKNSNKSKRRVHSTSKYRKTKAESTKASS